MKLWVGGTTLFLAGPLLLPIPAVAVVGAVIMIIGAVLTILDR